MTSNHRKKPTGRATRPIWRHLGLLQAGLLACMVANLTPSDTAWAQSTPPQSIGSGKTRTKMTTSGTPIQVEQRTDDVTKQKKQKLSEREKRNAKGGGLNRTEIEGIQIERQLGGALDREIAYSEKLLPTLNKKSEQRPMILHRLIESYHQKATLTFFEESRRYDDAWKVWDRGGRRGSEPMLSQNASKAWTGRVIQKAQQFITEYPNHKRIDEPYFQIAFAFDSLGQRDQAAQYYSQIVKKYPNSKRIPDAHFSLGEYYFDKQNYKLALTSYQETEKYTRANIYPWAVYKTAWCYYNLQDYRNSLGAFKKVVSLSATASSLTSAGKLRLKEEALREMVNVYAELNDIVSAERYFSEQGGEKYYGDLLLRLAGMLRERGQYEASIQVLKKFVAKKPNSLKAAEIQIQIVDTAARIPDKRVLWSEMRTLLSNYRVETPWAKANVNDPGLKELAEKVHTVGLTTAKQLHADFQRTKAEALAREAANGYSLYILFYGARPEAIEVRFLVGELQYQQGNYPEALKSFWPVAELKEKSPYFKKAADYVVSSAYQSVEKPLGDLRKKAAKQDAAPESISPALTDYVKACDKYITWFPSEKDKVLDCQVDTAEIYLKHNQYAEAEKRLTVVAKTYPDRSEGKNSATLLLWLNQKNEQKLLTLADDLSKISQYQQGDLGKRLKDIKKAFRLKGIEKMATTSQDRAGMEYEKFALENPADPEADKAWFNAGVNYRKSGSIDKAIAAFSNLYTKFPKSPQAPDAILNVAEMSEDRLDLETASRNSSLFLQRYPTDKRSAVLSRESCFLYDALNNVSRATETCTQVINSKRQPDALNAARTLGDIYYRNRRFSDYMSFLENTLLKMNLGNAERMDLFAKAVDVSRKTGRAGKAQEYMGKIEQAFAASPRNAAGPGLTELAKSRFSLQMREYEKYRGMRIEARKDDGSDLIPSVQKKNAALDQVEKAFKSVATLGDPEWAVASLYMIGNAFEIFAADLRNPPIPRLATEEDMKTIRLKFGELAKGPTEKARVAYEQALAAASKEAIMTSFTTKTTEALARINPKGFRKLDEWIPTTIFVGTQWAELRQTKEALNVLGGAQ